MSATLVELPRREAVPAQAVPTEPAEFRPEILREEIDFIRTYARYADVVEMPRSMHQAVGVQIVASVLNRNGVRIPHGGVQHSLDLLDRPAEW